MAPPLFPIDPVATIGVASYIYLQWMAAITGLLFIFALGAIVGSFLNVVVYRLPLGLGLVTPPSRCPHCETRLTWRENFPIFGWISLGGKCRFCRSKISPEYPIVETLVAALFALLYLLWFIEPGVPWLPHGPEFWRPEWARDGLLRMWPTLLQSFVLIASLVAISLIDARTFTIPLSIPWLVTAVAFIAHPLHALYIQLAHPGHLRIATHPWTIPTLDGPWLGATLGASLGLAVSCILLATGRWKRSFADYEAWEAAHQKSQSAAPQSSNHDQPGPPATPLRVILLRTLFLTGPAVALMSVGFKLGLSWFDRPLHGMGAGMAIGLLIGVFLRRLVHDPAEGGHAGDPIWVQYPHGRREMLRELVFLAPCLLLGWLGFRLASEGATLEPWLSTPDLWLRALGGSLAGYLVGGGVVWALRIGGTLALGREAMGLGDVHLMAAAGAVLGWVDPTIAFFVAPFLGLSWTILAGALGRYLKSTGTALPYGPHLAAATVLVLYLKPLIEAGLSVITGRDIDLP